MYSNSTVDKSPKYWWKLLVPYPYHVVKSTKKNSVSKMHGMQQWYIYVK